MNLQDRTTAPTLEEIAEHIRNPLFQEFCSSLQTNYKCREKIEYSACSMEPGWNVKFKKSGKALCTIYPRESYFTAMLVVGRAEKEPFEAILPACSPEMRKIYQNTKEGNGMRWLMIDLEDQDELYNDVLRLIAIRAAKTKKPA